MGDHQKDLAAKHHQTTTKMTTSVRKNTNRPRKGWICEDEISPPYNGVDTDTETLTDAQALYLLWRSAQKGGVYRNADDTTDTTASSK
jgi:hypothetical protein